MNTPNLFTYRPPKQPVVIRRKLGKHQAWGTSEVDKRKRVTHIIEIDERLKGKRELEILIHEKLHIQYPQMTEEEVIMKSRDLTEFLWKEHYRKVELQEK